MKITLTGAALWTATLTLMIGTLAAVMGSSTINTALPDIMSGLGINQDQVSWVATSYMLANVIAIPSAAWLGDLLTRRWLFGLGVAMFLLGSVLCGLSWDFGSMIAFRVFQGLGAGLIMPTAQAMLFEIFPPEKRGLAMGIFGMGAIMGPAIGPTVGGWLVQILGWRSIFFVNGPFSIASMVLIGTLPAGQRLRNLKFDTPGFVAMVTSLTTLQIAVSNGAKDGWDAPYIIGCFVTAALMAIYLVHRELTIPQPLLDLRVFKDGTYNAATVVSMIVGLGLFGSTFLVPVYMGNLLGYSALQIGLVMLPGSLLMGVIMLVAGRLSDLVDNRLLIALGLGIFAYYLYLNSLVDLDTPIADYYWLMVWRGLGMGLVFSPLSAVALVRIPANQIAQASGLFNLTRQLAGTVGIAGLNTMLTSRAVFHSAVLGQDMARNAAVTARFLGAERLQMLAHGLSPDRAAMAAMTVLGGFARSQVLVAAYSDLFLICLVATLIGILPVVLIQQGPARG